MKVGAATAMQAREPDEMLKAAMEAATTVMVFKLRATLPKWNVAFKVPAELASKCSKTPERAAWLSRLPHVVEQLERRWNLHAHNAFDGPEVSAAWVAPAATERVGSDHRQSHSAAFGFICWRASR